MEKIAVITTTEYILGMDIFVLDKDSQISFRVHVENIEKDLEQTLLELIQEHKIKTLIVPRVLSNPTLERLKKEHKILCDIIER